MDIDQPTTVVWDGSFDISWEEEARIGLCGVKIEQGGSSVPSGKLGEFPCKNQAIMDFRDIQDSIIGSWEQWLDFPLLRHCGGKEREEQKEQKRGRYGNCSVHCSCGFS
ncbi:MAG: hypothetical protein IPM61_02895 [Chlorobi bacterium]|nr:hypothetical protein [Chlorobiota bacterium]